MPLEFTIRPAVPADAEGIAAIFQQTGWIPHFTEEAFPENAVRIRELLEQSFADQKSRSSWVSTLSDGSIAGFVSVHWLPYLFLPAPEGYVSELFVDERHRGNGIGRKLIETVESEAEQRGCRSLVLLNNRFRESYKKGFYRQLGWKEHQDLACFYRKL